MKLLHLSDLHIGKALGNFSFLEDQKYVLDQILDIIKVKKIEAVMIAGDIFDTSVASSEALDLYNYFIEKIIFDIKILLVMSLGKPLLMNEIHQAELFVALLVTLITSSLKSLLIFLQYVLVQT